MAETSNQIFRDIATLDLLREVPHAVAIAAFIKINRQDRDVLHDHLDSWAEHYLPKPPFSSCIGYPTRSHCAHLGACHRAIPCG